MLSAFVGESSAEDSLFANIESLAKRDSLACIPFGHKWVKVYELDLLGLFWRSKSSVSS